MGEIRVLALYGSPRRGGNTEILLDEFLKGAEAEGAVIDRLYIVDYLLTPCRECLACFQNGQCVIADDMQRIYERLLAADLVVLASPVFFYGVSGWIKALIDRAQALWARKYILNDPSLGTGGKERKGFFISVGGTRGPRVFDGAKLTAKYFFDALNADYAGELFFREVDAKGEIVNQPGALDAARAAGRRVVAEMRGEN